MEKRTLISKIYGGRMSRKNYIYWQGIVFSITLLLIGYLFKDGLLNITDIESMGQTIVSFQKTITATPYFVVGFSIITIGQIIFSIRRLQDIDRKWYWVLLMLITPLDIALIIYLLYAKGSVGTNTYGSPDTRNLQDSMLNKESL